MIEAVLFDMGGVIFSSPFDAFAAYEAANGLAPDTIRTINATNPDANAWAQLERSDVTMAEFAERFEAEAAALGYTVDAAAVLDCLSGQLRPEMVSALRAISGRLPLALLTNNILPAADEADSNAERAGPAEVLALFDVIVESSQVGVRKPQVRFYEIACERLGVEPARCVFLDDLGINLKPARAMGMTTIKVGDPGPALAELERVVGFPLS